MKRIAAAVTLVAAVAGLGVAAPAAFAADPGLCITLHVDINGQVQDVNQCVPPSA